HLVHDGVQRVLDQLEQDGIAQLAGGHAIRLGGGRCPPAEVSPQEGLRRRSRRSNAVGSCQAPVWMTMLPWASRGADPPGGARVVASYSSTNRGPRRGVGSRSCRPMTGVRNTPCVAPK